MSNLLLFLGASLALANLPSSSLDHDNQDWISFKQEHGKTYESKEVESLRLAIFANNKQQVKQFNDKLSNEAGFKLGLNHLADMSNLEVQNLNGFKAQVASLWKNSAEADKFLNDILDDNSTEVPDELDWRKVEGRVTHVKDQGQCGGCWAFASTGALEGQERRRATTSNQTVGLSEQNLIDCDSSNYACDGGIIAHAFTFIQKQGGLDDEQSYPYEAKYSKCRFNKGKVAFQDKGAAVLPAGDELKLKEVVAKFGPVAVGIDASSIWFQFYEGGVYSNKHCSSSQLDHAVLVVGYGTDDKLGDYWIVKNSWGPKWGEDGYILMARNRDNMCGIATTATIPTF